MRFLVTGGAGYIGNTVTSLLLANGQQVRAVDLLWFNKDVPLLFKDKAGYEFVQADTCEEDVRNNILRGVDYIIHTAAVVGEPASKKFPELTKKINYEASVGLMKAAGDLGVKGFIFLSTCSNYGVVDGLATEETPLKALSLYAQTKVDAEKYLLEQSRGLDWVICRLSTVYGVSDRMRFDLTVNDFVLNAYTKKHLDVFLPYTYRPYIHVQDVAKVIVHIVDNFDRVKNNVFNIGFEGENYQKIQIAEIIKQFIHGLKIDIVKTGTDLRDYQVNFSKLKKYLDIKNDFTVKKGVEEVLQLLENKEIKNPYEDFYYNTMPDLEGAVL